MVTSYTSMVLIFLESLVINTNATNMLTATAIITIRLWNFPPAKKNSDEKLPKMLETITPVTIVTEADFFQYPNHKEITANEADIIE